MEMVADIRATALGTPMSTGVKVAIRQLNHMKVATPRHREKAVVDTHPEEEAEAEAEAEAEEHPQPKEEEAEAAHQHHRLAMEVFLAVLVVAEPLQGVSAMTSDMAVYASPSSELLGCIA